MRISLLDPRAGYNPFTDRTEAREYLKSKDGRERVILEFTPSNGNRISTEITNAAALVGENIVVDHVGIATGRTNYLAINQHPVTNIT